MVGEAVYSVWKVFYMTYEEIRVINLPQEKVNPPQLIKDNLKFEEAQKLVEKLGFGHCIKSSRQG